VQVIGVTERLLTARELADVLGLSPATVLDRFEPATFRASSCSAARASPVRFRESKILAALEKWRFGERPKVASIA
jgi:predicted DNA-binding transcriptional regulator AlpA